MDVFKSPKQFLYEQGQPANTVYLVKSGKFLVTKKTKVQEKDLTDRLTKENKFRTEVV